ncbi:DoxX family protein [Arenibacter sp. ARW7G5Y1]|uniref:DoxX family protein n=1 Tax=Arenibacter sp. ARW7G5Y1 TaxID=2135619 RepID=UPI000D7585B4|nr:DoxX family protein [Arenibacter sp. ARW7G5Y1]PXX26347.1 putative oxidoreductase [Arenibacter sp. ARW7G5Y1]
MSTIVKISNLLFGDRKSNSFASIGLLIIRLIAGFGLIMHGLPKLAAPMSFAGEAFPGILQLLAVISEFGGGIALILGIFVPLASLGASITMFVGIVFMHIPFKDPIYRITVKYSFEGDGDPFFGFPLWLAKADGHSVAGSGSAELALLYFVITLCLFFVGGGYYSLDHYLRFKRQY